MSTTRTSYCFVGCPVCGKRVTDSGYAKYSHFMMHVRKGEMKATRTYQQPPYPKWIFEKIDTSTSH